MKKKRINYIVVSKNIDHIARSMSYAQPIKEKFMSQFLKKKKKPHVICVMYRSWPGPLIRVIS